MYFSKISLLSILTHVAGENRAGAPATADKITADITCFEFCDDYWDKCSNYNIYVNPTPISQRTRIPRDTLNGRIITREPELPRKDNLNSLGQAYNDCLDTCMKWPRPMDPADFPTVGDKKLNSNLGGDTIWCRKTHLSFASSPNSAAFHCPHAGNPAAGICRDVLVDGYTPYELLRHGIDTKHRLPYCDLSKDDTVADCQGSGINVASLGSVLEMLPNTVTILFLSGNDITSLGDDAFSGLKNAKKLKALYLNDCKLAIIAANALRGLSDLEVFNFDQNFVETLDTNLLKYTPKLKQFSGFRNFSLFKGTHKIPAGFFSHTPNLEVISLYGTAITEFLPGTFNGLRNLRVMSFVGNKEITENSFPSGLFDDLVSLQFFDFFGNKITTIREGFFGPWAKNIIRIALWDNPIGSIHPNAGFENLDSIEMAYFHISATFDMESVAKDLMEINPMVTITYG